MQRLRADGRHRVSEHAERAAVTIDLGRLREYLLSRGEAQSLLLGTLIRVRDNVQSRLSDLSVAGIVGELDRGAVMARFPELGYNAPLDWVAFGFRGHPFYDAHVGVVLETDRWPVTYHVGLHLADNLWILLSTRLRAIEWLDQIGQVPQYSAAPSVREHRLSDPARTFDFAAIDDQVIELASRAEAFYRATFETIGQASEPRQF